jgi:diguanylate cyclase (GGDEF)-like protein/PAS domain S-box-containing protein
VDNPNLLHSFFDVTEHSQALAVARLSEQALASISQGVVMGGADGRILWVNAAFESITGYAQAEMPGQTCAVLQGEHTSREMVSRMRAALHAGQPFSGELLNYRKNGSTFWNALSIHPMVGAGGELTHFVGVLSDVTERRAAGERIDWLSHFDPLTGLPNRMLLTDRATHDVHAAQAGRRSMALMVLGVDHFKAVNESFGHAVGDAVLKQFAQRLRSALRDQDTVARVGGDEFVLVLPGETPEGANDLALRLLHLLAPPFLAGRFEVTVTASIGVAMLPTDGQDFEALFKSAGLAMHRAKDLGRGRHRFFSADMFESAMEQARLVAALRMAIPLNQLELHYQPFVDLRTGRIDGMEALLRWSHPELGRVPPSRFIPVAEKSGLIVQIGTWVLRRACQDMRDWLSRGLAVPAVSVNFSPVQLRDSGLVHHIAATLREFEIEPHMLCVEVTEGALMEDVQHSEALLRSLKALGVTLSLDDFGTGYSSLSYLKLFPFDKVKIDQSFVRGLSEHAQDAVIAKVIISMAHGLDLQVVAEGVETEQQCEFMRANQCDQMQGYLFSKPVPSRQMEHLLRTDHRLSPHLMRAGARKRLPQAVEA